MQTLFLDKTGECEPPSDALVITTEVSFLEHLGKTCALVIRGESLCRWAEYLWMARGGPVVSLLSPVDELMECTLGADRGVVAQFYEEHAAILNQLPRPIRLQSVLEAVYPTEMWRGLPNVRHAAQWLLWLDEIDPPSTVIPLLRTQAMLWRATATGTDGLFYELDDPQKARDFLPSWLGYGSEPSKQDLPVFPLDIPQRHLDAAKRVWRSQTVSTKGALARDVLRHKLPRRVKEEAAEVAYNYFEANRGELTQDTVRVLSDYLVPERMASLRRWLPPALPTAPPSDGEEVETWFKSEYLPYRQWCLSTNDAEGLAACANIAKQFAMGYLKRYPASVASGDDALSFVRSGRARTRDAHEVTLFVIADGLCSLDAERLIREVVSLEPRLTVAVNDIVMAPIPTITEVCKPALIYGCTPRDAREDHPQASPSTRLLAENTDPTAELKRAQSGDFFIWSHLEPDHTYHSHADLNTLLDKVDGAVKTIAARVVKAANAVPAVFRLRIILTTDHGRLLGTGERACTVPKRMTSHQRAALGGSNVVFPPEGYCLYADPEIVILNGARFGISSKDHCAIVLSENCFMTNDGKTGTDHFPHGGLFPEEVLLPWCEIVRDHQPPEVICTISGTGREGRPSDTTIHVINSGAIDVHVTHLELQFRDRVKCSITLDLPVSHMKEKSVSRRIEEWPTPSDLRAANGLVHLRLPVGDEQTIPVLIDLKSEGLYSRDNILDDLL